MSYFGLVETVFRTDERANGPLADLFKDVNSLQTLRYPEDLGSADKAHYIVFYAKKQKSSKVATPGTSKPSNTIPTPVSYAKETISEVIGTLEDAKKSVISELSNIQKSVIGNVNDMWNTLTGNSEATKNIIQNSVKQVTGASFNFLKNTQTSDAIALYMPDTLMYTHNQHYDALRLGDEVLGKAMAAGKSALDAYKQGGNDAEKRNAMVQSLTKSAVLEAADAITRQGASTRLLSAAAMGVVSNPLLEMIYNCPDFRTFNFEFMFYPRSQKESLMVQDIINRFYFHHAPELVSNAQGFLVPPSEFDIKMYYNGSENPNIPTIASCVLESIIVNYAPLGFSAYEIPVSPTPTLGGTGMPVAIHLLLSFRETSYLTKEDFTR